MRKLYYSLFTVFALLFTLNTAQAQLFEDFESSQKLGYAAGSVDLETGTWFLEDALIRSDGGDSDLKNGSLSVRIRDGFLRMDFDKSNGVNEFSFYAGNSGFSGDGEGVLQVYYSTDEGSNWNELGEVVTLTDELEKYSFLVEQAENIRFRINKTEGGRVNIDDVRITDYITAEDEATITVSADGEDVSSGDLLSFSSTPINSSREKEVEIKNIGNEELVISEVTVQGAGYSISSDLADSALSFNETATVTLIFTPESEGALQGALEIASNAANAASFALNISGEGFDDGEVILIAEARELPFETRVTVGGRVTVANEFDGPAHIQDHTAAIAVYWPDLHTAADLGDSVVVTGPLTEFNPINGAQGDFLMQIAATDNDSDVSFEVIDTEPEEVTPKIITLQEMNSGNYEAQLVLIQNVTIDHSGAFQGETNYDVSDASGTGLIRIDGDANVVGATAPDEPVNIIGVVDQFNGDYQLKPRFTDDLGVDEVTYPGEDIPKDETFEVVTWNIEWFGSGGNGPDDLDLQFENVKTVIAEIDADLYAFQEISSTSRFADLVSELEAYGGVIASFSQSQKTAYLFKRATIDSLDSGMITTGMTQSNWANGRFPLFFQFNAAVNGENREIYSYNIHAKAFDDQDSYDQRDNASRELKLYLDNTRRDDNVIFLGDYNDTIIGSITSGQESPYKNFDEDSQYTIITKSLEERGLSSQSSGSMIDHITINSELHDEYFEGTERVENTNYIGSYLSTTSDHYPIWTRFQFEGTINNTEELAEIPASFSLEQNYPNPFNPSTVISYQLAANSDVTLEVFDMLGRRVSVLVNGDRQVAGSHQVTFDASNLSSGIYIYRLHAGGKVFTQKMTLIK